METFDPETWAAKARVAREVPPLYRRPDALDLSDAPPEVVRFLKRLRRILEQTEKPSSGKLKRMREHVAKVLEQGTARTNLSGLTL